MPKLDKPKSDTPMKDAAALVAAPGITNQGITNKADERLFIPRAETESLEQDILRRRHIERYAVARQFVHGVTVDSACGCGYGTHILAKNPDVTRAYGIDMSAEAVDFATREYGGDRVKFIHGEIGAVKIELADTLVSIETIEHLEAPKVLNDFVEAHAVESLVVSFPIKKTTHYNQFHHWDFKTQDIADIFFNFSIYKEFLFQYDTCFVCLVRHNRPGRPEKRWRSPDLR
ncbi:MAG: methyltransferase domain-containing protein [Rhodospirillaceae bacterium]|nr:MAG: methyltransferase domain-containing protein [Rhodospirillaceae bacterium]